MNYEYLFQIFQNGIKKNVRYINSIFSNCKSLLSLPDISKWNTEKITDMSYMLTNCFSLSLIPNISKWNVNKTINISEFFSGCYSLSSLPDISRWNINNVRMNKLFLNCRSLVSLPDISKWNFDKNSEINLSLDKCLLLINANDTSKRINYKQMKKTNIFENFNEKIQ